MKKTFFLFTILAMLVACSDDKVTGISTVETENASLIQVVYQDKTPVTHARVKLSPLSYPDTLTKALRECETDSLGYFHLDSSDTNVAVEILANGEGVFEKLSIKDSSRNRELTMAPTGSVHGNVALPIRENFAWIMVYGTDRVIKTDSLGNFSIDSLAPANYKFKAVAGDTAIEFDIEIEPGKKSDVKTVADLRTWPYSRQFKASDLISSWMPIATPTVGFVRLNASNFDFNTSAGGKDIWFTDNKGSVLESEIAYWDTLMQEATLRVKLPDTNVTIYMLWGNADSLHKNSENIWKGIEGSVFKELYALDIVDFESGKKSNLELPAIPTDWYFSHSGDSVTSLPTVDNFTDSIVAAGAGRTGHAFHWTSEAIKGHWSFFGIWLCHEETPCNFSGIDSVEFYIRGKGKYSFSLEFMGESAKKGKALYEDTLQRSDEWTRKVIKPGDFIEGDNLWGNIGWENVQHNATNIAIAAYENADIWLDDIKIYGINRDDIR